MPVGTGTLYVQHRGAEEEEEDEERPAAKRRRRKGRGRGSALDETLQKLADCSDRPLLRMERSCLNVTQRQESQVVQYLALGGFRHFVSKC